MLQFVQRVLYQLRESIRARVPEKVVILASYVPNAMLLILHTLRLIEETELVCVAEMAIVAQLLLPALLSDFVPLFHYLAMLSILVAGYLAGNMALYPLYYYALATILLASLVKVEPVLPQRPIVVKISTKLTRSLKRLRPPRTREEIEFTMKIAAVHIASILISTAVLAIRHYPPAILVLAYSLAAFVATFLGVGASPLSVPKAKHSLALLFIMRYPGLYRFANRMKEKIHRYVERAGLLIYELEFVAKAIVAFIWYLMALPAICVVLASLLPFHIFLLCLPMLFVVAAIIYQYPVIYLKSKIHARKVSVEKEYPLFLIYASTLVSAGFTLYHVFRDLAYGKGSQLFKAFAREARYFLSLVEKQGMSELAALEAYAAAHPSSEFRNFIVGYLHQRQLGGKIVAYMEQKVMEALDALKRRMEQYVNQIVTLTEIALSVLVLPTLPMIVGFIIAPSIVYNMLFMQMFAFIPAIGFMFYLAASHIQLEFRDEYRFTFIPSLALGIVGLVVAMFVALKNIVAGAALVGGMLALGYYIEYVKQRAVYSEIERMLPQLFRDLSQLRETMPLAQAIERLSRMGYPRNLTKILARLAALSRHGVKVIEQPWHSKSWFWKFTQFLIGKIEESGGGTPELFRQLMIFFTEFNNIMRSLRSSLRIYEFVVYAIPLIFGVTTYTTLGIFVAMGEVSRSMGVSTEAVQAIGMQVGAVSRLFIGIDPMVLRICDVLILEMSLVLGLLAGKVISGTVRDTRALAVSLILASMVMLFAPQMLSSMFTAISR